MEESFANNLFGLQILQIYVWVWIIFILLRLVQFYILNSSLFLLEITILSSECIQPIDLFFSSNIWNLNNPFL